MDLYTVFKFLHVIGAIAWVGGGITMFVRSMYAMRDGGPMAALQAAGDLGAMGARWFLPASAVTLVTGIVAAVQGNLWQDAWILLGLAGFACTFLTGHFVLRVKGMRIGQLLQAGDEAGAVAEGMSLLRVARFDYTVMLIVVADMVLKPMWSDAPVLALMAATVVAGAIFFLVIGGRTEAQAA